AVDAGRLLAGAVSVARIASNYFAQIAAGLLTADERLTRGEFRAAIRRAFVEDLLRRGRVDLGRPEGAGGDGPRVHRATHVLVRDGRRVRLVRRLFHAAAPAAERRCNAALDGCTTSGGAFRPGMSC
ncbi:MAG: hypothetical protein ACM3H9_09230, partial [Rhodospirillaceae bacterium]